MRLKLVPGIILALFLVSLLSTTVPVSAVWDPAADVSGDGKITITDVSMVSMAFGSSTGGPSIMGAPYDAALDVNSDDKIDIIDLVSVAIHFGETEPLP